MLICSRVRLVDKTGDSDAGTRSKSPGDGASEKVVIDPGKGGAVEAKATQSSKALEVPPGNWVWDGVARVLEVDLFSTAWEARHGSAMALRELLKVQGKCGGMQGWSDMNTVTVLNDQQTMYLKQSTR